jgi:nitrile hydratase
MAKGLYNLDEFRDAVERIDPARYYGLSYYERWFEGVRMLLIERGIVPPETAA